MSDTQAVLSGALKARVVPPKSIDQGAIVNEILLSLPAKESAIVLPELEPVDLRSHEVLNEMGEQIQSCYFVNTGMVSILTVMGDGKGVEVGIAGKEGFIGLPVIAGFRSSATRAIVQIAGTAFRVTAAKIGQIVPKCPLLERKLNRYAQLLAMQASQVAACNRLHDVEERMARWLLMTQDRVGEELVPLTQEFLSHMLGTRRASVTVAAGALQKAGLIKYTRGSVTIANRAKLEETACECYDIIRRQSQTWHDETQAN